MEEATKSAKHSRDYFREAYQLAVSGRLSDDGEPPKSDHPVPYLVEAIADLATAVHDLGQASLAFHDRAYDSLRYHGNNGLVQIALSIESYNDFLRLSGGTPPDTFGLAEKTILFDLRIIEALVVANGWQDDTPMPDTLVKDV